MPRTQSSSRGLVPIALACLALGLAATALVPQEPTPERAALPFHVGEELAYRVRAARLGTVGRGTMRVEGPLEVRGRPAYLLRFDFRSRVGPFTVQDSTRSWLDPERLASLRYYKRESHPLRRHTEQVELFPEERRWRADDGTSGASPSDAPLDELSFIYFVRTLPLRPGDVYRMDRHFRPGRNPVVIRVVGREPVSVPAGDFATVVVEMRVRDPDRYQGEGVIRLHLSDDACRVPIRIESSVPTLGTMLLTLEAENHPALHHAAR